MLVVKIQSLSGDEARRNRSRRAILIISSFDCALLRSGTVYFFEGKLYFEQ